MEEQPLSITDQMKMKMEMQQYLQHLLIGEITLCKHVFKQKMAEFKQRIQKLVDVSIEELRVYIDIVENHYEMKELASQADEVEMDEKQNRKEQPRVFPDGRDRETDFGAQMGSISSSETTKGGVEKLKEEDETENVSMEDINMKVFQIFGTRDGYSSLETTERDGEKFKEVVQDHNGSTTIEGKLQDIENILMDDFNVKICNLLQDYHDDQDINAAVIKYRTIFRDVEQELKSKIEDLKTLIKFHTNATVQKRDAEHRYKIDCLERTMKSTENNANETIRLQAQLQHEYNNLIYNYDLVQNEKARLVIELETAKKDGAQALSTYTEKTAKQIEIIQQLDTLMAQYKQNENRQKEEIQNLHKQLSVWKINSDKYQASAKEKDEEIEKLNRSTSKTSENLRALISDLSSKLKRQTEQNEALNKQMSHLYETVNSLTAQVNTMNGINRILKEELDAGMRKVERSRVALSKVKVEIEVFDRGHLDCRRRCGALIENVADKCKDLTLTNLEKATEDGVIRTALREIEEIERDVEKYRPQIDDFAGSRKDRTYLHVKEMLLRALVKLDNVESQKKREIQDRRRRAIGFVKRLQENLEERIVN